MAGLGRYFRVGAAKVDITPPLEVPYLGFEPRHGFFRGVHDRLYVRTLVVSDGKRDAAVVNADLIGFSNTLLGPGMDFTAEVRKRTRERTGIPADSLMLTSSHIHSTPDTLDFRPLREASGAAGWLESLIERIAESAVMAKENMFDASLKIGAGRLEGFSKNRRSEPCLDTEVIVLAFVSSDTAKKIFAVNFACHPVIVQVQDLVSTDYVGVMQSQVEHSVGGTEACLFLQGACADINPSVDDSRNFDDVDRMGQALANEIFEVYRRMSRTAYEDQPLILRAAAEKFELPSRPLPLQRELDILGGEILALDEWIERESLNKNSRDGPSRESSLAPGDVGRERREHGETKRGPSARLPSMIELKKKVGGLRRKRAEIFSRIGEGASSFEAEVQVLRLGNGLLVGISGEPFCAMGRSIKEKAKPLLGVPVGYANGYIGYIVPPESWARGGYETECGPWSKVGPESYPVILEFADRAIKRM